MFDQYSSLDLLPIYLSESEDRVKVKVPPPSTYEEWLVYNNIDTWPVDPVDEINDKSWLQSDIGTMDELCEEVKQKVPFQMNVLDEIEREVDNLGDKVAKYSEYFFTSESRQRRNEISDFKKYMISTVEETVDNRRGSTLQKQKESMKARNMELASFPGFKTESTILPGALEAPQLLNSITKLLNITPSIKKVWKNFFLSEASVGILQDAFWWIFLEYSKRRQKIPNIKDIAISQSQLFDRMATNYITLFISVPYHVKDYFFKQYPNALSQAIYSAFFSAFPLSTGIFNSDFREHIVELIHEWISGVRPQVQEVLKTWNIEVLEGQDQISLDTSQFSTDVVEDPFPVMKSHLSFNEDTFLDFPDSVKEDVTDSVGMPKRKKDSHTIGPGADFRKLAFNVFGQGPFIKHYLGRKHLQNEDEILNKIVTRTELHEKKEQDCLTYNEVVREHKRESKLRKKKHDQVAQEVSREMRICNKKQKEDEKNMRKIQKELLKSHFDIKILSQKIMDMMETPDIAGKVVKETKGV